MLNFLGRVLVATISIVLLSKVSFAELTHQRVVEFSRFEYSESLTICDGSLWFSYLASVDPNIYRLDAYDTQGKKKLASYVLGHRVTQMECRGKDLYMLGQDPKTLYFIYSRFLGQGNGRGQLRSTNIPLSVQTEAFGFFNGDLFFTDSSVNRLARSANGRFEHFGPTISRPRFMIEAEERLFVTQLRGNQFASSLTVMDREGRLVEDVFGDDRKHGLYYVSTLGGLVFVSETWANHLHVIDAKTLEHYAVQTLGSPRGMTTFKQCMMVVSGSPSSLIVMRVNHRKVEESRTFDLSQAGDQLKQPSAVQVNLLGEVFVRSNYMCSSCTGPNSSQSTLFKFVGVDFSFCD
jgi:hypothetical protein